MYVVPGQSLREDENGDIGKREDVHEIVNRMRLYSVHDEALIDHLHIAESGHCLSERHKKIELDFSLPGKAHLRESCQHVEGGDDSVTEENLHFAIACICRHT